MASSSRAKGVQSSACGLGGVSSLEAGRLVQAESATSSDFDCRVSQGRAEAAFALVGSALTRVVDPAVSWRVTGGWATADCDVAFVGRR